MLTLKQLENMCHLQNQMNLLVNRDWVNANYDWLRAAANEFFELYDHVGQWKWWRKMSVNETQGQIELVDVFHFLLSHTIQAENGDVKQAAKTMHTNLQIDTNTVTFDRKTYHIDSMTFLEQLDLTVALHAVKRTSYPLLKRLFDYCNLSPERLYYWYISKNVLNTFRKNHGYDTGTYIKSWPTGHDNETAEDNVFLEDIANGLDITDPEFPTKLYKALESTYHSFYTQ
ncbi:dUTPase [Alteromonas sp. 14N.309.X.WAT.G.H12]|uniref:dUTPase n=1 Tax=Alteromonas sp. 14N.309.X.WAT.G.H12 TaxID=3120824 RepID=UPI002FD447D3